VTAFRLLAACLATSVVLSAFAISARAADAQSAATVGVSPMKEGPITRSDFADHTLREQVATFGFGPRSYSVAYRAAIPPKEKDTGKVVPIEGYIGMPRPSSCNWYHGGFLAISINGQDIGATPITSMMGVESGERAIVDMVWETDQADVRARFFGLPGQDYLATEITIDPKQEITRIGVALRCYPSFFTAHHKRDGARRIKTPATLIEQGNKTTLPAAENWWAVYYDEIFDVANGEGDGPCAMLMPPGEASEISFDPGSYAVSTSITYPPHTRTIHLAFWDFTGATNAAALERVEAGAEHVSRMLVETDYRPRTVQEFNVAETRELLEGILQSKEAREALQDDIEQIQTWLTDYAPALETPGQQTGVVGEERLLKSIDMFQSFRWRVKLYELIADI
jgi:hypothetical protein